MEHSHMTRPQEFPHPNAVAISLIEASGHLIAGTQLRIQGDQFSSVSFSNRTSGGRSSSSFIRGRDQSSSYRCIIVSQLTLRRIPSTATLSANTYPTKA